MKKNYSGLEREITHNNYRLIAPLVAKYMSAFVRLTCAPDLLANHLFPNAKEITESMGAYNAVKTCVSRQMGFDLKDPDVNVVCVGDGSTPRTAALFAYRSNWRCWSIDPLMNVGKSEFIETAPAPGNSAPFYVHTNIQRLIIIKAKIEDIKLDFKKCVMVCVHSHAQLPLCSGITAEKMAIVAIPCCVKLESDSAPYAQYQDYGIWSPEREVKVWLR